MKGKNIGKKREEEKENRSWKKNISKFKPFMSVQIPTFKYKKYKWKLKECTTM